MTQIGLPDAFLPRDGNARYILITQCMQNDFFLTDGCRLKLPKPMVSRMLINGNRVVPDALGRPNRQLAAAIEEGPLGLFLNATIGRAMDGHGSVLHVINIRDCHVPGDLYDRERRRFGPHCEYGTWGARYLEGAEKWLNPDGRATDIGNASYYEEHGSARIFHIVSDSMFDFKLRECREPASEPGKDRRYRASELEDVLDVIVEGSTADQAKAHDALLGGGIAAIHRAARQIDRKPGRDSECPAYIAVIGVYTDIKVRFLLALLQTQYDMARLAVSDSFTASPTMERHLAGLDFADKMLGVEVVHGVNDLVRFLGGKPPLDRDPEAFSSSNFGRYQSFFQDKQNVLAFQDQELQQYLDLTEKRSVDVYERIKRASTFLMAFGCALLASSLLFAILNTIWPDRFDWKAAAVTGGVGLAQIASAFVSRPAHELQQSLSDLAVFKMVLESHSLKTALARFHLTTPHTLRDIQSDDEREAAQMQIELLRSQMNAIHEFDCVDFRQLGSLASALAEAGTEGSGSAAASQSTTAPTSSIEHPAGDADKPGDGALTSPGSAR